MPGATPKGNLASLIEKRLPPQAYAVLRTIAAAAGERGVPLYLVGGVVRDLLLGRETLDLDLAVEGEAHDLATMLAKRLEARTVTHGQFGTAKLYAGSLTIDLAMTRTETYSRPGALPEVRPGSIEDDLRRRDFTINAIAVALWPGPFGKVLDPLRGRADLKAGRIRVLHERSFVEDPTRILRGLRYQVRFRFRLERKTRALLVRDAGNLARVSGDRIRHEIERTLQEPEPEQVLAAAHETGVLAAIHPALRWDSARARWFANAQKNGEGTPPVYMALLGYGLSEPEVAGVVERLALPNVLARPLQDANRLRQQLDVLGKPGLLDSDVYDALAGFSEEAIAACRAATDSPIIEARLGDYLERLRSVKPELDGRNLIELGVAQGPTIGSALAALRKARLDRKVQTKDDEIALVREWLKSGVPAQ